MCSVRRPLTSSACPDPRPTNSNLELRHIYEREVPLLSGGELQRFAIGTVCVQQADV